MTDLHCGISLPSINVHCGVCRKCSAQSKSAYYFNRDLTTSQVLVQKLKNLVQSETDYTCADPTEFKHPDIRVLNSQGQLVCRIEAKMLEDKPFMKLREKIEGCDLYPKETIVVDYPKLQSYIARAHSDGHIPTYVVWHLGRPCADIGGITIFQNVLYLEKILCQMGERRFYGRRTGAGDFVDGAKLGITGKYHFSVRECRPIEELIPEIRSLKQP